MLVLTLSRVFLLAPPLPSPSPAPPDGSPRSPFNSGPWHSVGAVFSRRALVSIQASMGVLGGSLSPILRAEGREEANAQKWLGAV